MLDIQEDNSDSDCGKENYSCGTRHDLNVSRALSIAINDSNIDGIMLINILRVAMGHRILLHQGRDKIQHVVMDEEKELTEDEEIDEFLKDIK